MVLSVFDCNASSTWRFNHEEIGASEVQGAKSIVLHTPPHSKVRPVLYKYKNVVGYGQKNRGAAELDVMPDVYRKTETSRDVVVLDAGMRRRETKIQKQRKT